MAASVITNCYLSLAGTNLSDHVVSIETPQSVELQDKTAMGATARARLAGLQDWSMDVEFLQDYAASSVDATVSTAFAAGTVAIEYRPVNAAASSTNPKWTGTGIIESYAPVSGTVGETAKCRVSIKANGALTRALS